MPDAVAPLGLSPSALHHYRLPYLSAITAAYEHLYSDVRLATNSPRVRKVMRGVRIQFSKPVARKDPLTLSGLVSVSGASPASYNDWLFAAVLLAGFHGLHRFFFFFFFLKKFIVRYQ